MRGRLKKAPHEGAFFVCVLICCFDLFVGNLYASNCDAQQINEYVNVDYVYDGDTVRTEGGRKVRIIGIDTPELARDKSPVEPFAEKARQHLITLIGETSRIGLVYDEAHKDKYGRLLAHAYNAQGENIATHMLEYGLATLMTVPPNIDFVDCYYKREKEARRSRRGIWQLKKYQLSQATKLNHSGYHVVSGEVTSTNEANTSISLAFGEKFLVKIQKTDLQYFKGLDFRKFKGKTLIVRGKVYRSKRGWVMPLRHISAMELAN